MIEEWEDNLPEDMHLAYLPNPLTGVRLRLSIYGSRKEEAERRIDAEIASLKGILGDAMYSEMDDTLEGCIGRILAENAKTLSTAESCTGGTISALITSIAGSSAYFLGSVTSYANSVKTGVLGVPEEIISRYGAVSSECVAAMAEGVRKLTGSDYSVATSGIAGPGGGSDVKPVGLVWIGVSSEKGTETFSAVFKSNRKRNIERFASTALNYLRVKIVNELK
jgi:nicotinamide-nucleotide amidase